MKLSSHLVAVVVVTVFSILRLIYAAGMDIHPDEAYYWTWSRMLDWSFNDQGPGIALYMALFTGIFGDTIFALKLGGTLAAAVAILLVYFTAVEMGLGTFRTWLATLIMALLPGFFGGALLMLHDSVLLLCWCGALYCVVRFIHRKEWGVFYLIFLFLGFGVLTKYTMVFFALSIVLWFFVERSARPLIRTVHFWLASLLGAVLSLPLLIWNAQNDWEGIDAILHLRSSGGANAQEATTGLYLAGQALSFSPLWLLLFLLVVLVALVRWILGLHKRQTGAGASLSRTVSRFTGGLAPAEFFRAPDPEDAATADFLRGRATYRFILIQSLLLPIYFLYFSLDKTVQPNWVFPAYPAMALVIAANRIKFPSAWTGRLYDGLFTAGLLFVVVFDLFILFSVSMTSLLPGSVDPFWIPGNRVRGFREAISSVAAERERIDPDALIAANRYQDAAIASWYLPGQPYIPSVNILQKNQYSFWPGLQKGKNYFIFAIQENTCERAAIFWGPILRYMFEEVQELEERDIIVDGAVVKRYNVFYAKNFKNNWDRLLVEYLNEKIVLDFMPNLKGKFVGLASKKGQKTISKALSKMYLDKKGSSAKECAAF